MAGNPKNASVWAHADVYVGPLTATNPIAGAPFGPDWDNVGLLNGEDGFGETMAANSADHFAWGGILVATTRSQFKLTRSFTAFEDNATVYDLVYPGNDVTFDADGGYAGDVHVPDLQAMFKIAFQLRTGTTVKRVISKNYAQVEERGDSSESETSLASRQLTVAIYPTEVTEDGKYTLFETYKGPISGNP